MQIHDFATEHLPLVNALCQQVPLDELLKELRKHSAPYEFFQEYPEWKSALEARLDQTVRGFHAGEETYCRSFHQTLNLINEMDLSFPDKMSVFNQSDPVVAEVRYKLDAALERFEDACIPMPFHPPKDPQEFARWFRRLVHTHEVADHRLFRYLEEEATHEQMAHFFLQESTVDARFDDLVALIQVGMDGRMKMELAQNYWDELGNGNMKEVHTHLFNTLLEELGVTRDGSLNTLSDDVLWESLACGNVLVYTALRRKNVYKALGAMGTTEMQSPKRFSRLVRGFKRLGLSEAALQYHTMHISIDTRHGNGWLRNAILPAVEAYPPARYEIVKGAFYRLHTSQDYCDKLYALYTSR
jgi:pyrroloquinoline quinone (PQQ) biosynthesis protein C